MGVTQEMTTVARSFYVYWLQCGARCYFGATTDPARRLRQHNGELAGGARRTTASGPWHFHCIISGLRTWQEALCLEWALKYHSKRCRCIDTRKAALEGVLQRERWTSNSPPASEVSLVVEYLPLSYGSPPIAAEPNAARAVRNTRRACRDPPRRKKKAFKAKLHGVTY